MANCLSLTAKDKPRAKESLFYPELSAEPSQNIANPSSSDTVSSPTMELQLL